MRIVITNLVVFGYIFFIGLFTANAQTTAAKNPSAHIPYLRALENHTQLIVEGKPFLMVAGELHNSTSSAPEYFSQAMQNAKEMNLNTVIASVAWEQFEPSEGSFDYALIDFILKNANEKKLKVVLIWFATWKNGESSYVPLWVKKDAKRFFRVKNKAGESMTAISPFCEEAMFADARAFAKLMKYIKDKDINRTIIMMQPENEAGAFSEMDYNKTVIEKFKEQVPQELVSYLLANHLSLEPELKGSWEENGKKTNGSWSELFGERNYAAQNYFMSWQYAKYMNEVSKKGKKILPLPMYVNAWLVQYPDELPGKYPNGGPVSRVMDIYKAAAPDIDFIAPDIYLPDFKEVCSMYSRHSKRNPLFIPECERTNPGKAYYAFATHDALGFGPFGIESLIADDGYSLSFRLLKEELLPIITQYQGTGKMKGLLREGNEDTTSLRIGEYTCHVEYTNKGKNAYGIIIQTGEDEFLVAGINLKINFETIGKSKKAYIGEVQEGGFYSNGWLPTRYLNGDETWHNSFLFVTGRSYAPGIEKGKRVFKQILAPLPVLNTNLEVGLEQQRVESPGVYKVKLYQIGVEDWADIEKK
jgi:beta-galactosidase GanA